VIILSKTECSEGAIAAFYNPAASLLLSQPEGRAGVVICDISATLNALKSLAPANLLSPDSNIHAIL
jgi:hypothetical protein